MCPSAVIPCWTNTLCSVRNQNPINQVPAFWCRASGRPGERRGGGSDRTRRDVGDPPEFDRTFAAESDRTRRDVGDPPEFDRVFARWADRTRWDVMDPPEFDRQGPHRVCSRASQRRRTPAKPAFASSAAACERSSRRESRRRRASPATSQGRRSRGVQPRGCPAAAGNCPPSCTSDA